MQVSIKIEGLDALKRKLGSLAGQSSFAASKALNTTAFEVNKELKTAMSRTFAGGATAYSLRAFSVERSTKAKLVATVALRTDNQGASLSYDKALAHLFQGGLRKYKKIEGLLRAKNLLPNGMSIAPGSAMRLDRFGNMNQVQLKELLSMVLDRPTRMRIARRTGRGKAPKMVDYFVVHSGSQSRLHPGIYKRIETGKTSAIDPMILFIRPVAYRSLIDIKRLASEVVDKTFNREFNKAFAEAMETAK